MLETKDMLQVSLGRVHRWNLAMFASADLAQCYRAASALFSQPLFKNLTPF